MPRSISRAKTPPVPMPRSINNTESTKSTESLPVPNPMLSYAKDTISSAQKNQTIRVDMCEDPVREAQLGKKQREEERARTPAHTKQPNGRTQSSQALSNPDIIQGLGEAQERPENSVLEEAQTTEVPEIKALVDEESQVCEATTHPTPSSSISTMSTDSLERPKYF
ncbi:hypothetical protein NEAUS04_2627, partial [Nematocida ausubeli]